MTRDAAPRRLDATEPAAAGAPPAQPAPSVHRSTALAVLLIVVAVAGLVAAFSLTLDKIQVLEHPDVHTNCYFNLLFQCDKNLGSWQGSVFGFPNPVLGLMCFPFPLVMGVGMLAGVRFPRWWWALFTLGMLGAFGLVVFFVTASVYSIGTLCPWCMVVWSVVIPGFVATASFALREGVFGFGAAARRVGAALFGWTPLITFGCYLLIAVLAQLRLDVLSYL